VVVRGYPHRTAAVIDGRVARSSAAASPQPPEPSMRWPVGAATGTRARAQRRTGAKEQLPRRRGASPDAVASAATSALSRSRAGAHPRAADSSAIACSMSLLITTSTTDHGGPLFGARPRRPTRSPQTVERRFRARLPGSPAPCPSAPTTQFCGAYCHRGAVRTSAVAGWRQFSSTARRGIPRCDVPIAIGLPRNG